MTEVIGVRFRNVGEVYYFNPRGQQCALGERVIVETARGLECGEVALTNREVPDEEIVQPFRGMVRRANKDDLKKVEVNRQKEQEAFRVCNEKIAARNLDMHLVDVEYSFDSGKILFSFTAEGRVDFRELVKDLASVFHTRIELRQIGVRDEAKMLGGIGICGRPFCCNSFLRSFQPVSIKMAKEQGLSLNPTKISGACGRLMCCLKYEQEAYTDLLRRTPKINSAVQTAEGRGVVVDQNLLTGRLTVRLDKDPEAAPRVFDLQDVHPLREGRPAAKKGAKETVPGEREKNGTA